MSDTFFFEPWIGVDFDGTLVTYNAWDGTGDEISHGDPIPPMIDRVREWLEIGLKVKIFTARVTHPDCFYVERNVSIIDAFCVKHFGRVLPITATKDMGMLELWDDRAVRVELNTGVQTSVCNPGIYCMQYPTMNQVERASHQELARWSRFLKGPGDSAIGEGKEIFQDTLERESEILQRIGERFAEEGGWNRELSKMVGWD